MVTGRFIAESMAQMANGGAYKGKRIFSEDLIKFALEEQVRGNDLVLVEPLRWGIGFRSTYRKCKLDGIS